MLGSGNLAVLAEMQAQTGNVEGDPQRSWVPDTQDEDRQLLRRAEARHVPFFLGKILTVSKPIDEIPANNWLSYFDRKPDFWETGSREDHA